MERPDVKPNAKIPTVLLPVADCQVEATVAAVPALTTQPEYVYLFRVAERVVATQPSAKIPTVLLPVAEPLFEAAVAAPPAPTTQPEYVYLFRVVVAALEEFRPKANIPNVPSSTAVMLLLNALIGEGP